ncbi:hypothetical protein KJ877_10840 [bacterium]|nr:hypothetical protein [bacterium]MBU1990988.1 hypothetical protein [bacterium]
MLGKLLESLYLKVYVNIVVDRSKTHVYIEECNKEAVLERIEQSFDTTSFDSNIYEFIRSYTKETPFHYIAILDTSPSQGALPTCSEREIPLFCDLSSSKYLCYANKWSYYTSTPDLNMLQKQYKKIGLDLIFSPFPILANFFKDKIDSHLAIFILIEDNYITLAVFDHAEFLYGDHINMKHQDEADDMLIDDVILEVENSIDLDDIDAMDDISGLDDLGDIEDLDTIEDMEEFSDNVEIQEDTSNIGVDNDLGVDEAEDFNEDYQRFTFIQSSINTFYKDSRYKSKFVESVYIADSVGVSNDLKKYLEEEMFLMVYVRQINLPAEICETLKTEIK